MDSFFMSLALNAARDFEGATAPNPPVGACLVKDGKVLAIGAHQKAGSDHAEVRTLKAALENGTSVRDATLYVTLEPCNHFGKTPPCTHAILEAGIARVVYGTRDPNPGVKGGGSEHLRAAGVDVVEGVCQREAAALIRPFLKWSQSKAPWLVHKTAWRLDEDRLPTMIPPQGTKTFTRAQSLVRAHIERKKSDAIITGMDTVLADDPQFTVRHVSDFSDKNRWIIVLKRTPMSKEIIDRFDAWKNRQERLGFFVHLSHALPDAIRFLGEQGCHRALIEAGPRLSAAVAQSGLWDERLVLFAGENEDTVFVEEKMRR